MPQPSTQELFLFFKMSTSWHWVNSRVFCRNECPPIAHFSGAGTVALFFVVMSLVLITTLGTKWNWPHFFKADQYPQVLIHLCRIGSALLQYWGSSPGWASSWTSQKRMYVVEPVCSFPQVYGAKKDCKQSDWLLPTPIRIAREKTRGTGRGCKWNPKAVSSFVVILPRRKELAQNLCRWLSRQEKALFPELDLNSCL